MQTLSQLQSGALTGAKSLTLSCGLKEFPPEIFDLADTLEILDLSGNHLTHLPPGLERLHQLRIAFFSSNDFTEFPAVLARCPQLEMIGFKACQIQTIAEGAIPTNTRWLILTDNQLTKLPASIGHCPRLQKLMLAGNNLTELPAELAQCQNLELLRISANQLTAFPDWLFSLPRLAWLAFSGNPASFHQDKSDGLPEIPWPELTLAEELGQGASGIISKAHWCCPETDKAPQPVAVKVFKGALTSDGLPEDEMQACMAAGPHPHLVPVLGKLSQHPAQKQGLVFELIPAGYRNLGGAPSYATCTRDTYAPGTVFLLQEIKYIAAAIASASAHLHARGISHSDLYAHNTLVDEAGHALFGDFGAATLYDTSDATTAPAVERLEVRAFGCLLEDLLDRLAPTEDQRAENVLALRHLLQDCLQPQVLRRPNFSAIIAQLEELG